MEWAILRCEFINTLFLVSALKGAMAPFMRVCQGTKAPVNIETGCLKLNDFTEKRLLN